MVVFIVMGAKEEIRRQKKSNKVHTRRMMSLVTMTASTGLSFKRPLIPVQN